MTTDIPTALKPRKPGTFQVGNQAAAAKPTPALDIPKDRAKQADTLRQGAFVIAKHLEARIIEGLRRAGKKDPLPKGLREAVWCHGVEADKVLEGAQDHPSTVNQINLLFGSVAPALQRAILGKAFDVMSRGNPDMVILENCSQDAESPTAMQVVDVIPSEIESCHNDCSTTLPLQAIETKHISDGEESAER